MNFIARRKPIALLLCCGFTNLLAGVYTTEAQAQTASPLLVDPALLGAPSAPSPRTAPASTPNSSVSAPPPERKTPPVNTAPKSAPPPDKKTAPAQTAASATPSNTAMRVPPPQAESATSAAAQKSQSTEPPTASKTAAKSTNDESSWIDRLWNPVENAYRNGDWEFYLPLRTHHLRSAYSSDKIADYQESPLGFGAGLGLYDEKGNWNGVYALAFQDSHFKPMYAAGYGWKAIWRPADDTRLGLGYITGLMSRTDIGRYVPFPVILPMASVAYKNFNLESVFVPGGAGNGNVFFIWAKWELGKPGEAIGSHAKPSTPEPSDLAMSSSDTGSPRLPYGRLNSDASSDAEEPHRDAPATKFASDKPSQVAQSAREAVVDHSTPLALRSTQSMQALPTESAVPRPVFLSALRMGGDVKREVIAEDEAELRKVGTILNADRLTYWPIDDETEALGNVRLEQPNLLMTGPKMRLKLEDQIGFFEQPTYLLKHQQRKAPAALPEAAEETEGDWLNSGFASPRSLNNQTGQTTYEDSFGLGNANRDAHGNADRINFEGENQVRMFNGTYSTCSPGNDDWYAKTSELALDYDRETGEGKDGTVYFKGVPILYTPWLTFSLNDQRKSGFLVPSFGSSSDSGFIYAQPYYWNIAPNMDSTITPSVLTRRGVKIEQEFRYLNTALGGSYSGKLATDVMPRDNLYDGDSRWGLNWQHNQTLAKGFSTSFNYSKVSDDNFFTDLSSGVTSTSTTQLLQQAILNYNGGGWWNASANFQQYQTLQPDTKTHVEEAYRMLPQLTVNARKPDFYGADASFLGQYTAFSKPKQEINGTTIVSPNGKRTVLYPQIALPYSTPGWYVTPKIGVNIRHYSLSDLPDDAPTTVNTTLPIISVDSGMTFERPSNWFGRDYTQTLEPRLFYLNIPYKNQDAIPLFDTGLADFNFAQIFSENQFSSWDRLSNANQLTAAVTSRLIEPSTGDEIVRAMVGQRFYFTQNKVGLTPTIDTVHSEQKWERSDFLAAFSGQILPKVYADSALQYNLVDRETKRYSLGLRYQPAAGKVLNAAYRYNQDSSAPINQVDLSAQWPLSGRWSLIGRANYAFKDDGTDSSVKGSVQNGRMIQSIAGFEYNGGCWVVRGVVQRLALTQDSASSAFFIQLELSDFARIGSNPLDLLKRNIQGYSPINQSLGGYGE